MKKILFLFILTIFALTIHAREYKVKNITELIAANKAALPGDVIILENGNWHDVTLSLDATGTEEKPIFFKAETSGKVNITGVSKLLIGGKYIVVDGLSFNNGFSDDNSVITFRSSEKKLANYCRVTNIVINDYNPKRMEEAYWIALYGKHNRIDHCSFVNKKNMGVLIAVMLDTDASRENFHSIDHNYFGERPPLASNTGEIIRVGVSTYCEYNSNTQITDNYFYHCDGETEVISLKSGSNLVKNNLLEECQGSVVLRHGNYNTIANNIFLGNNKPGTGGIRIINKGQWVVNNFFYKCRGIDFRSPLSIMNGVPNSPANRYVEVTDAVVANNSFVDCTPISFAEGSDAERSVAPKDVTFVNNLFYNHTDSLIYHSFDDISGIQFKNNVASEMYTQHAVQGFTKKDIKVNEMNLTSFSKYDSEIHIEVPATQSPGYNYPATIINEAKKRGNLNLSNSAGFIQKENMIKDISDLQTKTGARWYKKTVRKKASPEMIKCSTAQQIENALSSNVTRPLIINLNASSYTFTKPLYVSSAVEFQSAEQQMVRLNYSGNSDFMIMINGRGNLHLSGLILDLTGVNTKTFISGDSSGSSNHTNLFVSNCNFINFKGSFFSAPKSNVSESVIIQTSSFTNFTNGLFDFGNEDDKKGYYNVEHLVIRDCKMTSISGQVLNMLRSGNDESTMGPNVLFENNVLTNCNSKNPLIYFYGTQVSRFSGNYFTNCNAGAVVIKLEDKVRAHHHLENNNLQNSGKIEGDEFVE